MAEFSNLYLEQWILSLSLYSGTYQPASNYRFHTEFKPNLFRVVGSDRVFKLSSTHALLWSVLLNTCEDLTHSPAESTLSRNNLANLCPLSRSQVGRTLEDLKSVHKLQIEEQKGRKSPRMFLHLDPLMMSEVYPVELGRFHYSPNNGCRSIYSEHPKTPEVIRSLQRIFPEHSCLASPDLLRIQAVVLNSLLQSIPATLLVTLLDHIVENRQGATQDAFRELSETTTLVGCLRDRMSFWVEKFGVSTLGLLQPDQTLIASGGLSNV